MKKKNLNNNNKKHDVRKMEKLKIKKNECESNINYVQHSRKSDN